VYSIHEAWLENGALAPASMKGHVSALRCPVCVKGYCAWVTDDLITTHGKVGLVQYPGCLPLASSRAHQVKVAKIISERT
jgi:hypothetical protein